MADVEAFVWHDPQGNITAVGRPTNHSKKMHPVVHGDRNVIKLSVAQEHLQTLHLTHKIDVAKGALARREY
jgi:hypothetical protein